MAGVAACNVAGVYHIDFGGVSAFQGEEQVKAESAPHVNDHLETSSSFPSATKKEKKSVPAHRRGTLEDGDEDEHATSFERAF